MRWGDAPCRARADRKMADLKKIRVGVLFGGRSSEHEISLRSALTVMSAMDPARYEVVPIGIGRDGRSLKNFMTRVQESSAAALSKALPVSLKNECFAPG